MSTFRITPVAPVGAQIQQTKSVSQPSAGFSEALNLELNKQSEVKFSAHAQKRLDERNVQLDSSGKARLSAAVDKVNEKGADKSLVLLDNLALVVSTKNRVVITAMDSTNAKEGVFTGIDSAIIA